MMILDYISTLFKKKMQNVFIIGTGRCGTTMLAQILNSHSKICVPHELQILFEYSDNGPRLYDIFKEKRNVDFDAKDFVALIETRCPHNFHEYFDYSNFFEQQKYPILSLTQLVNELYSAIAESRNKLVFIEQTPWYGQRLDILNELFPKAKYIHMIRDGRDVAISYARTPWWHRDIGQNLERWHTEVRQIIDSSAKILRPSQMLQVRYEDFIDQPETELARICEHLGVHFEDTMLDVSNHIDYGLYSKSNTRKISSAALNEWRDSRVSPIFKDSRFAWKHNQDFDFSKLPEHVADSLYGLGYDK